MPISSASSPIGVFDSGVGGLSVLRALRAELPHERFVYVADSGHAPYGERDDAHPIRRSHAIASYLIAVHGIKALVVACNTATAAAIHTLRQAHPALPIVGIEPALKPAAAQSQTGVVGVMATRSTLQSEKFRKLLETLHGQATFILQACDGLADAVERQDAIKIEALCAYYTRAIGRFGFNPGEMDTLVLGCTHYPLVEAELRKHIGPQLALWEGGLPVARHTHRLLAGASLLARENVSASASTQFFTTGDIHILAHAAKHWLALDAGVTALDI